MSFGRSMFAESRLGRAALRQDVVAALPGLQVYYRLVNVHNGWCADVKDASTNDAAYVIQWPATDGPSQDRQIVAP